MTEDLDAMTDTAKNIELEADAEAGGRLEAALLAATGFERCAFGRDEQEDACERCDTQNVQLYFGNQDYWTPADGDYWCLSCLREVKEGNDRYADEMGYKEAVCS
jgi:hypothetical protein